MIHCDPIAFGFDPQPLGESGADRQRHRVDLDRLIGAGRPVDQPPSKRPAVGRFGGIPLQGVGGGGDAEARRTGFRGEDDDAEGYGLGHDHRQGRERRHLDQDGERRRPPHAAPRPVPLRRSTLTSNM